MRSRNLSFCSAQVLLLVSQVVGQDLLAICLDDGHVSVLDIDT